MVEVDGTYPTPEGGDADGIDEIEGRSVSETVAEPGDWPWRCDPNAMRAWAQYVGWANHPVAIFAGGAIVPISPLLNTMPALRTI